MAAALTAFTPAAPAEARYATGGTGQYKTAIDWFEWGTQGDTIPSNGITKVNTRQVAGQELATTCVIGPTSAALQVQQPGFFAGDGLDDMYNIGGTGTSNQLGAGLATVLGQTPVSFDFNCAVTLGGVPVPLAGLVMGDAEASTAGEYIQATIPSGADWRIFDRYRAPGCTSDTANTRTGQTLRIAGQASSTSCSTYPTTVAFMENASSANVTIVGGGRTAIALGVVLFSDYGDAPASYGDAGALYSPGFTGGVVPQGASGTFATTLATAGQPATRLGAAVTPESAGQPSAGANADGADDGVVPSQIATVPGTQYVLEGVACTGPGFVNGWIDWNQNGTFDDTESSAVAACTNGTVDLTFDVPEDAVDGPTFMRLRIAADEAAATNPTGLATSGEVEDYAVEVALPTIDIEKTSTFAADSRPGDIVSYTVTGTNNSPNDFTEAYPAVVFDDLSGVLDDATLVAGSATATVNGVDAGPVTVDGTLLSWTGPLAAGDTVEITYDVTLKGGGDGNVRNVAWQPPTPNTPPTPPACDPRTEEGTDPVTGVTCAVVVGEMPKLSIAKSASSTELPAVGEDLTYTVVVTNEGPGDYTDAAPAAFTDDLSEVIDDATFDADSITSTVGDLPTYDAPVLSWSGALAAGESATFTYTVTYTGEGDAVLTNAACVPADEAADEACDTVEVPGAQLRDWKTSSPSSTPLVAGSTIEYTLHFENDGQAAATIDSVDDLTHVTDDADVTVEPTSADGLTVTRTGDRISVTGSVPAGETYTVTYAVTLRADGQRGDNIAANYLLPPDGNPPTDPVCAPTDAEEPDCTINEIPEISYEKTVVASDDPIETGSTLAYTITVTNSGAGTGDVSRADNLTGVLDDATLTTAPSVSGASGVTATPIVDGIFSLGGTIGAGETATVTYTVTIKAEEDRGDNRAANFLVEDRETPPPTTCEPGTPECTSTDLPNVTSSKAVDPASGSTVLEGDELTYTLTFTNSGLAAGGVDFTDHLAKVLDDAEVTGEPVASDPAITAVLNGEEIIVSGTLASGQTVTVVYSVTVLPDGQRGDNTLGNFLVRGDEEPPTDCVAGDPNCTENPVPYIVDSKSANPTSNAPVSAGQTITYTLSFRNDGAAAGDFARDDVLTAVLDDADLSGDPVVAGDGDVAVELVGDRLVVTGTLEPGASATVTYSVVIRPFAEQGDHILGNFLVRAGEQPPTECEPVEGEDADCTVHPIGEIAATKSVDPASTTAVKQGDVLTYTLTFRNTAPGAATVDYVDHMGDVLDDATLTTSASASVDTLELSMSGAVLSIGGQLGAGQTATVTYKVTVMAYDRQGNHVLGNFLGLSNQTPPEACVADNSLCTTNPIQPPPALAVTGGTIGFGALAAAILAILGGGLLLAVRKRRELLAQDGTEI